MQQASQPMIDAITESQLGDLVVLEFPGPIFAFGVVSSRDPRSGRATGMLTLAGAVVDVPKQPHLWYVRARAVLSMPAMLQALQAHCGTAPDLRSVALVASMFTDPAYLAERAAYRMRHAGLQKS